MPGVLDANGKNTLALAVALDLLTCNLKYDVTGAIFWYDCNAPECVVKTMWTFEPHFLLATEVFLV